MSLFQLEQLNPGRLSLSGVVDMNCAEQFLNQGHALLEAESTVTHWTLDLGGAERVDSALLAVLIDWVRLLDARDGGLTLINVPKPLVKLVNLYGLAPILL